MKEARNRDLGAANAGIEAQGQGFGVAGLTVEFDLAGYLSGPLSAFDANALGRKLGRVIGKGRNKIKALETKG